MFYIQWRLKDYDKYDFNNNTKKFTDTRNKKQKSNEYCQQRKLESSKKRWQV